MMVSGIAKVSSLLRRYESFIYRGQGELEGHGRIGEREGGIGIGEGSRGVEGIGRVGEGGVGELEEGGVKTSDTETLVVCKFKCPHLDCNFKFFNKRGLQCHMGRCK